MTASPTHAPRPAADRDVAGDNALLEVRDLRTSFFTDEGEVRAVDGVSFTLARGAVLALVGESGCGKTVTAYSILRLIQEPGRILSGQVILHPRGRDPVDILALPPKSEKLYGIRGGHISMIFQEPMSALSPVHTIGGQIMESILLHRPVTKEQAWQLAVEMLARVGIPNACVRMRQYPHELSGGMRQRVGIAMALVCCPQLLIADEPTTAVDVTIQAQIMLLLKQLQREMGLSVLLITHDLGVVGQMAHHVAVMYLGRIVERGDVRTVMKSPRHPYTMGLLRSLPGLNLGSRRLPSIRGSVPPLSRLPRGCPFHPRCPHARPGLCDVGAPPELRAVGREHMVACVRADDVPAEVAR